MATFIVAVLLVRSDGAVKMEQERIEISSCSKEHAAGVLIWQLLEQNPEYAVKRIITHEA